MKRNIVRIFTVAAAVMFLSLTVLELNAEARAGGGRSMGSRGSRSYSRQATPGYQSQGTQYRQQMAPAPGSMQQQRGGSFLRSMAGGIAGGLLGGMLFRGIAGAGGMGFGGGIGLFDILLLGGICYLIYRMVAKRRRDTTPLQSTAGGYGSSTSYQPQQYQGPVISAPYQVEPQASDVNTGISHVRQMDPTFDEGRFKDQVMDNFFTIQGGWMNRDLGAISSLLTDEMREIFRQDIDRLVRDKQVNRLENVAVRSVEIDEAWQESGQDYITALIYANLLDYTVDETSGAVVAGSKTEPVKFQEYWTFTRPVGNNPWRLSGISQG